MKRLAMWSVIVGAAATAWSAEPPAENAPTDDGVQYVVINPAVPNYAEAMAAVRREFPASRTGKIRLGIGGIFSYLNSPREQVTAGLREFLRLAQAHDLPVVVQLDGENWWQARSDLWNWWDEQRPGYDPANRANVEWTGWSPDAAVKISWRNWGRQLRLPPPPNLMSPRFREAGRQERAVLVPIVLEWQRNLPPARRDLLIGIKVGWEGSIGVNAWYYPNGNDYVDRPEKNDPQTGLRAQQVPDRGVTTIGYAAASTCGVRTSGELTEADQAEIVRRHLAEVCRELAALGVPRRQLFTHTAGWKEGELLYRAALNDDACPGWSFYHHAGDPQRDVGVRAALEQCNAPYWGAVEWFFQGPRQTEPWRRALQNTLADRRCRYLNIYNWEQIRDGREILQAVHEVLGDRPAP